MNKIKLLFLLIWGIFLFSILIGSINVIIASGFILTFFYIVNNK